MSGLEVVGLVCAIVSAFTGAAELIRRRKAKKTKNAKEAVEKSLALGPPTVRGEYDHGFARLGPRFAKGDGEFWFRPFPLPLLSLPYSFDSINKKANVPLSCRRRKPRAQRYPYPTTVAHDKYIAYHVGKRSYATIR